MIVISDATPLIAISILGRFELLPQLFGEIIIPAAVYDEIVGRGAGRIGSDEVSRGMAAGWLRVENISDWICGRRWKS